MSEHFSKLERMYLSAPCNATLRPTIHIRSGAAEVGLRVDPSLFHAAGAVHGSIYFKLLDDACFFAANSRVEGALVLTVSFHIQLMRPISKGTMTARGHVTREGRSLLFAEGVLTDASGETLARGSGVFAKSGPLTEEMGYA